MILFRVKLRVSVVDSFYTLATFLNQHCVFSSTGDNDAQACSFVDLDPRHLGRDGDRDGLIAALIAVAAVVVMGTVGTNLSGVFSQVAASL